MDTLNFRDNLQFARNKKSTVAIEASENDDLGDGVENNLKPETDPSNNLKLKSGVEIELSGATIRSEVLAMGSNFTEFLEKSSLAQNKCLVNFGKDNDSCKIGNATEQKSDMKINLKGTTIHADLVAIGSNFVLFRNNQFSEKTSLVESNCSESVTVRVNNHGKIRNAVEDQSEPSIKNLCYALFAIILFMFILLYFICNDLMDYPEWLTNLFYRFCET